MGKKKQDKLTPPEGAAVPGALLETWRDLRARPAVPVGELAAMVGLSHGRPKQLVDEDVMTRRPGGKYGPEIVLEYACWLRSRADARDVSSRGLIEAEKLRALKRENDLAEGRLFTAEVLQDALAKIVNAWVVVLEAVPVQWKRKFPETSGDELDEVKRFVSDLRNKLADVAVDALKD